MALLKTMMFFTLSMLFLTFSTLCSAAPCQKLSVSLPQGVVQGIRYSEGVDAWLGVPYAKAPIDKLRWEPPQKLEAVYSNRSIMNATQFGHACYQYRYHDVLLENGVPRASESEDCLNLNIFVPTNGFSGNQLLPVILWGYGGGFSEGDSSARAYDPSGLVASQGDLIAVTFNYRINLFGFPNSPGIPIEKQNMGIRDIRAALEWLRENLYVFGGDSTRITLAGQSAGADAAAGLVYAFPDDPIASALLLESGQPLALGSFGPEIFFEAAETVGCRNASDPKKELQCMKTIPAEKLRFAISNNETVHPFGTTGGMPMIDNLTVFTAEEYQKRGKEGKFARIPTFIGSNNNESNGALNWTPHCGVNKTLASLFDSSFFECPISAEASFRTEYSVPIWRYRYMGVFPVDSWYGWVGSYHTAEIPFILGSYRNLLPNRSVSEDEVQAAKLMQDAVGTFVRDPTTGLETVLGWPRYNTSQRTLVELFRNNTPSFELQDPSVYNGVCANLPPLSIDEAFGPAPLCNYTHNLNTIEVAGADSVF